MLCTENPDLTWKKILTSKHCKTICAPVRSEGFHRVINRIPPIRRISENEPYINNKPHISTVNIKVLRLEYFRLTMG